MEMVRGKILQGQGKVIEVYFVSGRIDILKKSQHRWFKAGVHLKAVFRLGILVLTQISRSRFKPSKISLLIPHIYVLGCFGNFFGDFWIHLGINSFSQRISKIYENRKSTRDTVWPGLGCTCVDLRWLALTLVEIKFARKLTHVFHHLATQPTASWVISIRCYSNLLANEIQDIGRAEQNRNLEMVFFCDLRELARTPASLFGKGSAKPCVPKINLNLMCFSFSRTPLLQTKASVEDTPWG